MIEELDVVPVAEAKRAPPRRRSTAGLKRKPPLRALRTVWYIRSPFMRVLGILPLVIIGVGLRGRRDGRMMLS